MGPCARARRRLAAIGTGFALAATLSGAGRGGARHRSRGARGREAPRFLIHLIDGGDPIVVQKYVEEGGQIRFEKYGGWVGIPSYEVLRIVPDESEDTAAHAASGGAPAAGTAGRAPLYVATRSGATVRATAVGATGSEVRVSTPEGSLTFHRTDLVGVLRVPAAPGAAGGLDHPLGRRRRDRGGAGPTDGGRSAPPTPARPPSPIGRISSSSPTAW